MGVSPTRDARSPETAPVLHGADATDLAARRLTALNLLRALRAFSLPVSLLPVVLATAAVLPVERWRWDVLIVSVAGVALFHCAGNLLNDYFDFRSGVDRLTDDDPSHPGRLLVQGRLLPQDVLLEAGACFLLASVAAAYVLGRCGAVPGWFALAAAIGLYAYTGPPFRLKYRALGELTILVVFGPLLMTGAAWVQTGHFEPRALLLSLPVGLLTTSILAGNSFRDRQEDSDAGITTIGSFAQGRVARVVYLALVLAGVGGLAGIAAAGIGPKALWAAPLTLGLLPKPLTATWHGERLADIDARTARFETVLLLLVLVSYLIWPPAG